MAIRDGLSAYWNFNNDGSGGVSLSDYTGNGYTLTNVGGVTLGTGIVAGCAVFNANQNFTFSTDAGLDFGTGDFSVSMWVKPSSTQSQYSNIFGVGNSYSEGCIATWVNGSSIAPHDVRIAQYTNSIDSSSESVPSNTWTNIAYVRQSGVLSIYINGTLNNSGEFTASMNFDLNGTAFIGGGDWDGANGQYYGSLDEMGVWNRALTPEEVTILYTDPSKLSYLYYNNNQEDGDWGNLLNWWQDSGFTIQATALPTGTTPVNLYNQVTQNTQGANQCFCSSASFWSADFGVGLTLQSTGVVNMQGSSVMAGATTDGVSMHDSSTLTDTSSVAGDVTMRDSSRAFGYIGGNAYVHYDQGNGQFPIGGTVAGSVSYLGWPAVSPQWFNDQATGGGHDGDFSNKANWWTDNTYTTRPINSKGTQELPDASTDVFIAPNTGITANTGAPNPTINSVTANNSNIQSISLTATNGFLFSGNEGVANAVLYGDVIFQDTAYNDHSVINGKATYKSAVSLQYSWGQNSLGNVNAGMYNGSTSFEVDITGGEGSTKGFLSSLLGFPWYIRF